MDTGAESVETDSDPCRNPIRRLRMLRRLPPPPVLRSLALVALLAALPAVAQTPDTTAWLADFAQLRREMADHYANLEWAVEARDLDLAALTRETEAALHAARDEAGVHDALRRFVRAFGDGHLDARPPASGDGEAEAGPLCEGLGYTDPPPKRPGVFEAHPAYRAIATSDTAYAPIGVLDLGDRRVGVLRIWIFMEYAFPDLCEAAAADLGLPLDAPCEACDDAVERHAADRLTAALVRQVEALTAEGIDALVVDVTRNGGGTNWVEPAARTLTAVPLRAPRLAVIRHDHWRRQLRDRLATVEADAAGATGDRAAVLADAAATLRAVLPEVDATCDRTGIWDGEALDCSLVIEDAGLYATGVLPYAAPGSLPEAPSSPVLFYPSRYVYHEGVYDGPLVVAVDRGTASSAEYFVAMLRDNGAATVLGQPTFGAGCGYTNGGIPTTLERSGIRVKMPDCIRLRADGTNEVAGITPDVLVPWETDDTPGDKAARAVEALRSALD